MSRSRRHTPFHGRGADSDQPFKHMAHRCLRRAVRLALLHGQDTLPLLREVSNVWSMPKDGKFWFAERYPNLYRK